MSSSYIPPTGPPGPHEPSGDGSPADRPQESAAAYGSAKPREGTSAKTAILFIGIAGLIGLLVLGALLWAITRAVPALFSGGGEEPPPPPPTTAVAQPTQEVEPTRSPSAAASSPRDTARTSGPAETSTPVRTSAPERSSDPARAGAEPGNLKVPTEGALFTKEGSFEEIVLDKNDDFVVELPEHEGPMLITWSVTSDRPASGVMVNAYESKGGKITKHLGRVTDGQTGMWLINVDPDAPASTVLYPQGSAGTEWKIQGFPLSKVTEVERGAKVTGSGPAVIKIPAGAEQDYRFMSEDGVPRIEVYDADDLSQWVQFEFGMGPERLGITAGADEQIIMLHGEEGWALEPQ